MTNSSCTLPEPLSLGISLPSAPLGRKRLRDAFALARSVCDLPHMLVRQLKVCRDRCYKAARVLFVEKLGFEGGKIHGGNQLSVKGHYAEPRMPVKEKTRLRVSVNSRPEIAEALKSARNALGLTQSQLAAMLGSSQGAITRWERGIDTPPAEAFLVLAELVPEEQRELWLSFAGLKTPAAQPGGMHRTIPVLRDPAAAGTPRAVDESEIDFQLSLPNSMLPRGGKLYGFKIAGDSMSPMLEEGYIALIDVAQKSAGKLVGRMVAAREGEGITIKWLRREGEIYLLVPQNARHSVRVIKSDGDFSIVGVVVKWIGEPPITN